MVTCRSVREIGCPHIYPERWAPFDSALPREKGVPELTALRVHTIQTEKCLILAKQQ